jgi:hypothetical protein
MKSILTLTALLLATNVGHANGLQGVWQSTGQECQSGAPSKGMGAQVVSTFDATAIFTADQMRVNMQVSYKYEKGYAKMLLQQLQDSLKQWDQLPDSAEKQKSVVEIRKSLDLIASLTNGVTCSIKALSSYSATGTTIRSQQIQLTSTCPGSDPEQKGKTDEFAYVLDDQILKVISSTAESSETGSCPKGDRSVYVFQRIK